MKRNIAIVVVGRIKSSIPPKKDVFLFIAAALLLISLFGSVVVSDVSAADINETDLSDNTDAVGFVETAIGCNIAFYSDYKSISETGKTSSGLSYYADALRTQGYTVTQISDPITSSKLSGYDALLMIGVGEYLTSSEKNAIEDFVENQDKGLLISGGSRSAVNDLAQRFTGGSVAWFGDDIVCDPTDYEVYPRWVKIQTFYDHPITKNLNKIVMFKGFNIPAAWAFGGIIGCAYSDDDSWLDEDKDWVYDLDESRGAQPVLATSSWDKIVIIPDSNVFDNYDGDGDGIVAFNEYDNDVLGLNIVEWLAGGGSQEVQFKGTVTNIIFRTSDTAYIIYIDEVISDPTGNMDKGEMANVGVYWASPAQVDSVEIGDRVEVQGSYTGYENGEHTIALEGSGSSLVKVGDISLLWKNETLDYVYSVSVSENGEYVAFGSKDTYVYYFNKIGDLEWKYKTNGAVRSVSTSNDGNYIIAGSEDHHIYYFDKDGFLWEREANGPITTVDISSDGRYAIAGSVDGSYVYFFDSHDPKKLLWKRLLDGPVNEVSISDNGEYIGIGGWGANIFDKYVYLLDKYNTEKWKKEVVLGSGSSNINVDISGDGNYVIVGAGSNGETTYVYKRNGDLEWDNSYDEHGHGIVFISSVGISADGIYSVVGTFGWDITIRSFDKTGNVVWRIKNDTYAVDISGDGHYIAAGASSSEIGERVLYIDNFDDGNIIYEYSLEYSVGEIDLSKDGKYFAAAAKDTVYFFGPATDEVPFPKVKDVDIDPPTCVKEGESATISVTFKNYGGPSSVGYISVSFPNDETILDVSGTGDENTPYPKGSGIWGKYGKIESSEDPLAELKESQWDTGQEETLIVTVMPNSGSDKLVFYVRAALKNDADGTYERDPIGSNYIDQQSWPVYRHSVDSCNIYPNLIITGIYPNENDKKIYYKIKNIGGITAGPSYSHLYVDDMNTRISTDYVYSLQPNEERGLYFDYSYTCYGGSDTIKVCADGYDKVNEADDTDNCKTITKECGGNPESLIVDILNPADDFSVVQGVSEIVKAKVTDNLDNIMPGSSISLVRATFTNGDNGVQLFDDGAHDDGAADDGIYANEWVPTTVATGYTETACTIRVTATHSSLGSAYNEVDGVINRPSGSLTVTIYPTEVRSQARWKLASGSDTNWHSNGDTITNIPIGSYTIQFKGVSGWNTPSDKVVTITEGSNSQSGRYTEDTVEKYALIIGINDYDNDKDLKGCVNDARAIYNLLVYGYGYQTSNVEALSGTATGANITAKLDEFSTKVDSNDIFIFYFSGHGYRLATSTFGEEYICAKDRQDLSSNYLSNTFNDKYSGTVISIFDSCHSGGMALETDIDDPIGSKGGIDCDKAVVLMGCEAMELTWEKSKEELYHGVFTYYLYKAFTSDRIKSNIAPRDKQVSIEEAFNYAAPKTTEDTCWDWLPGVSHPQMMDHYLTKYASRTPCHLSERPINPEFIACEGNCPIHLHAYDSEGRHTGMNAAGDGIEEEIPGSFYNGPEYDPEEIIVLGKSDNIIYKIEALDEGVFNFTVKQGTETETTIIAYLDVPVTEATVATIDVNQANPTYTMKIDTNGDGIPEDRTEPDSIDIIGDTTYSIQLHTGWNLISLPITPDDSDILDVMSSVDGNWNSVWSYEAGTWKRYDLTGPGFLNDLTTIEHGKGYWINMKSDDTLYISGSEPTVKSIPLVSGWNLVGYNSLSSKPTTDAMNSIDGNWNSVWSYEAGTWKRYDLTGPDFLNDLTTMEPGKGYWINMKSPDTWTLGD